MCRGLLVAQTIVMWLALVVAALCMTAAVGESNATACLLSAIGERSDAIAALPGSREYADSVDIDNKRLAWIRPLVVAIPQSESDLALSYRAALTCGVPFSVLSGGHSAAGYCLSNQGLVLSMRGLNGTSFATLPDGTHAMTIHSGTRFRQVYDALLHHDGGRHVVTGGGCHQVAVGGFVLGGGWSFLSRPYGLAIDNVLSMRLMLPNGTLVTLPPTGGPDPELSWALRGGGGGNFGILTSVTLRTHQPDPSSSIGVMCWPQESPAIITMFARWINLFPQMPKWLNVDPVWLPRGAGAHRHFCWQVFCINLPSECASWLAPLRAESPTIDTVKVQPYLPWQAALGNETSDSDGALYIKSFVFKLQDFTVETVRVILDSIHASPSPHNLVLFHVAGGAVADVASNASAFPYRDAALVMQLKAIWHTDAERAANMAWIDALAAAVRPNVTGAYVNYIDAKLADWPRQYYGAEGYARLLDVKRRVDPYNRFRFNQSIGASP